MDTMDPGGPLDPCRPNVAPADRRHGL